MGKIKIYGLTHNFWRSQTVHLAYTRLHSSVSWSRVIQTILGIFQKIAVQHMAQWYFLNAVDRYPEMYQVYSKNRQCWLAPHKAAKVILASPIYKACLK